MSTRRKSLRGILVRQRLKLLLVNGLVVGAIGSLLGTCNLIFWPLYAEVGLVPMGIVSTAMHGVFVVLQLWAYFVRSPVRSAPVT